MKELRFTPGLFRFLEELKANNDREWFDRNRSAYFEEVRDPFLAFIAAFRPRLNAITPWLVADPKPVGGSMFRIHRDTRFSKSKDPYKTHAAAYFHHQAGKENTPGIYLHLEPAKSFLAMGLWRPDTVTRRRVTDAIYNNPEQWGDIVGERAFKRKFRLEGESLARAPKQYSPGHPFLDDLRRKDFIISTGLTQKQVCDRGFIDRVEESCRAASPFLRFLTEALDLPWKPGSARSR